MVILIACLFTLSVYLIFAQTKFYSAEDVHLPQQAFGDDTDIRSIVGGDTSDTIFATWLPISKRFQDYEQRVKAPTIRRRLIKAGSPVGILEFFAFKILTTALLPTIALILSGNAFPKVLVGSVSLAAGFFIPDVWLNRKIKIRQHSIRKDLPNIIDLLNLCVSGGLDFMLAVNRVVRDMRPCDLTQELAEVYRQTVVGKSRREALKHLGWRVDMAEVYSFVRTLVQADRMGSPLADALKIQSEEIRVRRFQRGEAMALKAPIKLLFPLFAFILPVVLILVGGPIILQFGRTNVGIGF
jgi:tight adherence protein C